MKIILAFASLLVCVLAQDISIEQPTADSDVVVGLDFTVKVLQQGFADSIERQTVRIDALSCSEFDCSNPATWGDGAVMYDGPFEPHFDESSREKARFETFNLTMPNIPSGPAAILVRHEFQYVGASESQRETNNATVRVNIRKRRDNN